MKSFRLRASFILMISFLTAYSLQGTAQNNPISVVKNKRINFIENSWPEALKRAEKENKYIFVDAYASWCGPCKLLKITTFRNKRAAEFFDKNFINLTIDVEKGQGIELASEWGVQAYPTLYIFDSKGKLVSGMEGFVNANGLIKFGQRALNN